MIGANGIDTANMVTIPYLHATMTSPREADVTQQKAITAGYRTREKSLVGVASYPITTEDEATHQCPRGDSR